MTACGPAGGHARVLPNAHHVDIRQTEQVPATVCPRVFELGERDLGGWKAGICEIRVPGPLRCCPM